MWRWLIKKILVADCDCGELGRNRGNTRGHNRGQKAGRWRWQTPYVMVGLSKELRWYDDALRQGFVALKRNTREINSTKHLSSIPGRSCDQCSIAKMGSWNFALPIVTVLLIKVSAHSKVRGSRPGLTTVISKSISCFQVAMWLK